MPERDRIDEGEIQRLLDGSRQAELPEEGVLADFVSKLRSLYAEPPSEEVERVHVAQAVAMARELADEPTTRTVAPAARRSRARKPMTRRRLAFMTAIAVAAAPFATAGLAFAGVSLPGPARAPFEELGIELPNQAQADDVNAVLEATEPAERDCRFGERVAAAASAARSYRNDGDCRRLNAAGDPQKSDQLAAHQPDRRGSDNDASRSESTLGLSTADSVREEARRDGQALGGGPSEDAQELSEQQGPTGSSAGPQQAEQGQAAEDRYTDPQAVGPPQEPVAPVGPRAGVEGGTEMPRSGSEDFQP